MCLENFEAEEQRHMSIKKESIFVGLWEYEDKNKFKWVFGCLDQNTKDFGFVPSNYLKFVNHLKIKP